MASYSLRRATPADIDTLVRHRIRMFEDMGRMSAPEVNVDRLITEYRAWLNDMMPSDSYVSWVIEDTDPGAARPIVSGGGATIIPWPPGPVYPGNRLAFVYNVYTEPEHRGRGLARQVMSAVHGFCQEARIHSIALNASEFGQSLYESMGYRVTPSPMMFLALG